MSNYCNFFYHISTTLPKERDPLDMKAEPSKECRLWRFLVATACI